MVGTVLFTNGPEHHQLRETKDMNALPLKRQSRSIYLDEEWMDRDAKVGSSRCMIYPGAGISPDAILRQLAKLIPRPRVPSIAVTDVR